MLRVQGRSLAPFAAVLTGFCLLQRMKSRKLAVWGCKICAKALILAVLEVLQSARITKTDHFRGSPNPQKDTRLSQNKQFLFILCLKVWSLILGFGGGVMSTGNPVYMVHPKTETRLCWLRSGDLGVSENMGVPYFGVLIIRILLNPKP